MCREAFIVANRHVVSNVKAHSYFELTGGVITYSFKYGLLRSAAGRFYLVALIELIWAGNTCAQRMVHAQVGRTS